MSARGAAGRNGSLRVAVAVPTSVALAAGLFALTGVTAAPQATAATSVASCADGPGTAGTGATGTTGTAVPVRHVSGGTREAIARAAAAQWFPASEIQMATAVAGAESSWQPAAVNRAAGGNYGLWQINAVHAALLRGRNWQDPAVNAWMAYQVWDAADGTTGDHQGSWTPWSTYNSGSFRAFLAKGAAPATSAPESPAAPPAASTDGPAAAGCARAGAPSLRVGTWNALKTNSTAHIAAGTRDLSEHTDVFGLQELGNPTKRAAAARGAVGFSMSTDRTAVPILYRNAHYTLLGQGRVLAFPQGSRVEPTADDKTSVAGPKFVTWVHLQDKRTRQSFYVLNTHLLVGAENTAHTRAANPRRVKLYQRQLSVLTTLADAFRADGSAVYATCDCNVDYAPEAAPVVTMRKHGLVPSWQTLRSPATHGKRDIDYVWSTEAPASQITGDHHGSDHAFLAVTFNPSASNTVVGGSAQHTARTRTVTDPNSKQTYEVPIPAGRAGQAIDFALDQLGDTWTWGSHGPNAWDCSGLTAAAWGVAGVHITPQSDAQQRTLRHVRLAVAQPGDIVWHQGYVGIYLGTVGDQRVVIGSVRAQGAVVIHTPAAADITAVLRPQG